MVRKHRRNKAKIKAFFLVFFLSVGLFVIFRYYPSVRKEFINKTTEQEFVLEGIIVQGIDNVNESQLVDLLPIEMKMPLIGIDIKAISDIVNENPWVDFSNVYIKYPNSLYINIKEKVPEAISKQSEEFVIVDKKGDVLTNNMLAKYESLPMIISDKDKIAEIIDYMITQPYFYDEWEKAEYIGDRRWNIYLKNNIKVMLPEYEVNEALEKLNELRIHGDLLKYKISTVDLRFSDKAIIK